MRLMVENERSLTAFVAGMTKMSWTTLTTSEKKVLAESDNSCRNAMQVLMGHSSDWAN